MRTTRAFSFSQKHLPKGICYLADYVLPLAGEGAGILKETKLEIKTEFLYYEMHTKLTQW